MKCTWLDCEHDARFPQTANDGSVWANLCGTHNEEINGALDRMDVKKTLSSWIKAQGGAKAAAKRMCQ